jgi:hypothetical protein
MVLMFAVDMIGQASRPISSALDAYQCEPLPCWHNIYPGKTTLDHAKSILLGDSNIELYTISDHRLCWIEVNSIAKFSSCALTDANGVVETIHLSIDSVLLLGDTVLKFGQPMTIRFCNITTSYVTTHNSIVVVAYFQAGTRIQSSILPNSPAEQFTPTILIDNIEYTSRPFVLSQNTWRGFSSAVSNHGC